MYPAWLLCLEWVADAMNLIAEASLGWRTPLEVLTGQTQDISILLVFIFWDVVEIARVESIPMSGDNKITGRFVGFAKHVGHALTFKILTDDGQILNRSRVHLADHPENEFDVDRLKAAAKSDKLYIRSKRNDEKDPQLPTIDLTNVPFYTKERVPTEEGEEKETTLEEGEHESTDGPVYKGTAKMDDQSPTSQENVAQQESQSPTLKRNAQPTTQQPIVETVEEEEDQDNSPSTEEGEPVINMFNVEQEYHSPMDDVPLKQATVPSKGDDGDDIADHLKKELPREEGEPIRFGDKGDLQTPNPTASNIQPEDMINRTFLMPPEEDGTRARAKIIERIDNLEGDLKNHPDLIKFKCLVNNEYEDVVAYNDICDCIEEDQTWNGQWKYQGDS